MIWWGRGSARRADEPEAAAQISAPMLAPLNAAFAQLDEAAPFAPPPDFVATRAESLEQLLEAFRDIADRDDIHQAADRLILVLEWIGRDAASAAADPIFAPIRLAS
jgi:predicted lipid-binding transport protein (Tim44 family)